MAHIKPFKGTRYNPRAVGDLSRVVAPPYDVISEKMQEEFYRRHPNNVIRLILGRIKKGDNKSGNRYTRAKRFLGDWLKKGILVRDDKPALYIYEQSYLFKKKMKRRLGFVALMEIEDPHKSRVLPHEYTFAKPKKDRLELLKATKTNLSPIFSLFEDRGSFVINKLKKNASGRPLMDVEQDGVDHRIWRLTKPSVIDEIKNLMEEKQIFIADGHHRYEVALNFRDFSRKRNKGSSGRPYDYIMVYFSNLNPGALTILSTHRVIRSIKSLDFKKSLSKLKRYFSVERLADKESLLRRIERAKKGESILGMYFKKEGFFSLALQGKEALKNIIKQEREYRWRWLDVTILHQLVFDHILNVKEEVENRDNIVYTRDADYAIRLVDEEGYQICFFLNPPRIEQVKDVARSHDRMPHKSTYFYPKPLSGLLFHQME